MSQMNLFGRGRSLLVLALLVLLGLSTTVAACGSSDDKPAAKQDEATKKADDKAEDAKATDAADSDSADATETTRSLDPLAGPRFFTAESPWNTTIDQLAVDSRSARMLELAQDRRAVREVAGEQGVETFVRRIEDGLYINTGAWAPLIVEASTTGTKETRFVCRQSDCGAGSPKVPDTLSIPPGTTPDPRFDGWLSVIDRENGVGYDFWRARRETDDMISYQYSKAWTLNGPGFSPPVQEDPERAVGARGSGLPLFAGTISPEGASTGKIDHALAIAVPGLARRNYVQPASVTDGVGSPQSLPAGARIRLRDNVGADRRSFGIAHLEGKERRNRRVMIETVLAALREYGAIVVDRAAVPTLYAPQGTSEDILNGSELSWLKLTDFEVVSLPPILKDPPLGKVTLRGATAA